MRHIYHNSYKKGDVCSDTQCTVRLKEFFEYLTLCCLDDFCTQTLVPNGGGSSEATPTNFAITWNF